MILGLLGFGGKEIEGCRGRAVFDDCLGVLVGRPCYLGAIFPYPVDDDVPGNDICSLGKYPLNYFKTDNDERDGKHRSDTYGGNLRKLFVVNWQRHMMYSALQNKPQHPA